MSKSSTRRLREHSTPALCERLEQPQLLSVPAGAVEVGSSLYFAASDAQHGAELWKSDLDGSNAALVKDINPGAKSSSPWGLTIVNGVLHFIAMIPAGTQSRPALLRTDGTGAGTRVVSNVDSIVPGIPLLGADGWLYFRSRRGQVDRTDGNGYVEKVFAASATDGDSLSVITGNIVYQAASIGNGGSNAIPPVFQIIAPAATGSGSIAPADASIVAGILRVVGTDSNDVIHIGSSAGVTQVTINGEPSTFDDVDFQKIEIHARGGNDQVLSDDSITAPVSIFGEAGNDTLVGGPGNNSLDGGAGSNVILQTPPQHIPGGLLNISGTGGDDQIVIRRNAADSTLLETVINGIVTDYYFADLTFVQIDAKAGNDRIEFDQTNGPLVLRTKMLGGAGNDVIYGSAGADQIRGGDGNDWISAGAGNDNVYGEAGDDRLFGGDGNDYLDGGAGTDMIRGDAGIDRIIAAMLDDFAKNRGDIVTLSA